MTKRINARLDAELAGKLQELQQRTGKSTTEILQAALERYYDSMRSATEPARLFEGFVGCVEGPRELSSNYKAELGRSLKKKTSA